MPYTVVTSGGRYGSLGVLLPDAEEALATAQAMTERGVKDVVIVDPDGARATPEAFGRARLGHSLTADQIGLIAGTCDVLLAANRQLAELFYGRLFALAPETRRLFASDLAGQKRKLVDTLDSMVGQITHPAMFIPLVTNLARRHAGYGVRPEHFGPVGEALLASLSSLLGARFTPEVRDAWTALYGDLADAMTAACRGSGPPPGAAEPEALDHGTPPR